MDRIAANGITLSFNPDGGTIDRLVIDGLDRVRFTSPHPRDSSRRKIT